MYTLNELLAANNRTFPFLAAKVGGSWSIVYDRVRFSNENDEDAVPEAATPVKNGYFYGIDPRETRRSLMAPDTSVWERWSPVRRAGQLRDVFDDHQTTCDSCGLGNTPQRCSAAEQIRSLYIEAKKREVA